MEFFKKHVDTVVVLGAIFSSFLWMNSKFEEVNSKIAQLDKEVGIVKTVLLIKNIMPQELAHAQNQV